jgi:steroid delta-isomerase-like uncharacterized protein
MASTDRTTIEALSVARNLARALNAHDLERIESLHRQDFTGYDTGRPTPIVGAQEIRNIFGYAFAGLPDFRVQVVDFIKDGSRIATRWRVEGTHKGTLLNIPPTLRQVSFEGYTVLTVQGDCIKSSHTLWDMAGLLRQLGLLPALPNERT